MTPYTPAQLQDLQQACNQLEDAAVNMSYAAALTFFDAALSERIKAKLREVDALYEDVLKVADQ